MKPPWLTSAWRTSKSGLPRRWRRLSGEPVMKLWSASTRTPRSRRPEHRCEPMNPAPPETTARGLFAANAAISETETPQQGGVVDVAPVDDDRSAHQLFHSCHVQLPELVPLGDEHERIRTGGHLVRVLPIFHFRQQHLRALDRGRVVSANFGAGSEQDARNVDARRLAHVVGVRLEGEPKQSDDATGQLLEQLAQHVDDYHALVAVDLHHGMQQSRVILVAFGYRGQGSDIFRKAGTSLSDSCVQVIEAEP